MKLIHELFRGDLCELNLIIQGPSPPKKNREDRSEPGPLITKYVSKIGNESLIYSPKIALQIKSRNRENRATSIIPYNLIYRFTSILEVLYEKLSDRGLFKESGSELYLDKAVAAKHARRLTVYSAMVSVIPDVVVNPYTKESKRGVSIYDNDHFVGALVHHEVLALIDVLQRFDVNTFGLVSAIVDQLSDMQNDISLINGNLLKVLENQRQILELLRLKNLGAEEKSFKSFDFEHMDLR